jgi:hypothetical protein
MKETKKAVVSTREKPTHTKLNAEVTGAAGQLEYETPLIQTPLFDTRKLSARAILHLQRTVGNLSVVQLLAKEGNDLAALHTLPEQEGAGIQRVAQPVANTPAQQWEADWNDPAFAQYQHHFNRDKRRPAGTPKERYDILCPLYQQHGIPRPLHYIANNIVPAPFYTFSTIEAHQSVQAALLVAENALKAKGFATAPVNTAWAFTPRTTDAGGWSNHASGKAIDFDCANNPHLTKPGVRKIITALTGYNIEKKNPGAGMGMTNYEATAAASEAFKEKYNPEGMRNRIEELESQEMICEGETWIFTLQLEDLPKGRKATREDRKMAQDIKARMKAKQAEIKALANQRKALEKELHRYEKTDEEIESLQGEIDTQEDQVQDLEDQIKEAQGKKLKAIKASLNSEKKKLRKSKNKLKAKEKARRQDPLRKYGAGGFMNLPKELVTAMTSKHAGFEWGGNWEGAKDFMHFEMP